MDSWRHALETYHRVFEALTALTKPGPGEVESDHHTTLSVLVGTANDALNKLNRSHAVTENWKQPKANGESRPSISTSHNELPDVEPLNNSGAAQHAINDDGPLKKRKLSLMQTPARSKSSPPSNSMAREQFMDDKSNGKIATTPTNTSATARSSTMQEDSKRFSTPKLEPSSTANINATPEIQYEDISAAVEARLKAKAERKKRAKESKKRKRGSMDSNAVAEARSEVLEPSNLPERPKKKAKVSTGSETNNESKPLKEKKARMKHAAQNANAGESTQKTKRRISATEEAARQVEGEIKRRKRAKLRHN